MIGVIFFILYLPVIILCLFSFNSSPRGFSFESLTLQWYFELFKDDSILTALVNSLTVAFLAGTIAVLLGFIIATYRYLGAKRHIQYTDISIQIPILLPDILLAVSLLVLFLILKIELGLATLILSHAVVGSAYAYQVFISRYRLLDPNLISAAYDLGATEPIVFSKIVIPHHVPAIVSSFLMAFTLSLDDFILSFFTAGAGVVTLPLKIYSMLKFGVSPKINALCALLLVATFVLVGLAWIYKRDLFERGNA